MGQIVAAMATCHAPALFLRQPGGDPAQLDATVAAMRQLGHALDETRPDALIVIGLDHLETFSLSVSPTFTVVVAPEVRGSFGPKARVVSSDRGESEPSMGEQRGGSPRQQAPVGSVSTRREGY